MAKIKVDKNLCTRCGACYTQYPQYLKDGGEGVSELVKGTEPKDEEVQEIIDTCPAQAISKA